MRKNALKSMTSEERHRLYWISELRGLGVTAGPNGESFEDMDYYEVKSCLVLQQMKQDLEPVHSKWF